MAQSIAQHRGLKLPTKIGLWTLLSVWPMLFYAQPLWQNALADTPIAYLIWIPILSMAWAWWNLGTIDTDYTDDIELDLLAGGIATVVTGFLLAFGPVRWPSTFVYQHAGLLLWPFWSLSLAWIILGLGSTRYLLAPLSYLFLAWPAIFGWIATMTQNILVTWAIGALNLLAERVPWLVKGTPVGTFYVQHGTSWSGVVVAQACSGADSLLGAAILLPLILTVLKGPRYRLMIMVVFTLIGALVINWLRLFIIVASAHWIGASWTFRYVHPLLGFLLFAGLSASLVLLAGKLRLSVPNTWNRTSLPGITRSRLIVSTLLAALLFAALVPFLNLPPGYFGKPLRVSSDRLTTLMPPLPGFTKIPKYYANESSLLGPGSATQADLYITPDGAQVLAEVWSTPSAGNLASYGFRNCLLYHGESIVAQWSFGLAPGIAATAYAVTLPPESYGQKGATYLDVEWTDAIHGVFGVRYQRWSVATFPLASALWPPTIRQQSFHPALLGLDAMVAPPTVGHWPTTLLTNRTDLIHFADSLFRMDRKNA
ncbi:hypothetical protein TPY_1886 [Sulfobacillus acidophilus TPY]|uniref:Exosortase EpsH-related protein n=1 Tax=Sulfobacillus acidophilus (strain ATCC 700253 / DSM 10332 / NAL) TaxID=679936 RepID=G8TSV9_SULAD|nr:hypothetical protein TPY_1886 [Sulfobacillus acidophilus TPY]AEW05574.1 Exosortase EpsH-related protein [Sulfobacillus acidophilus DSM 10332]